MAGYVDLYLLPLPKRHKAAYRRQAQAFGRIARKHGALEYREFIGDDLFPKGTVSFTRRVKLKRGEILTAAIVGFKSKSHRKKVLKKIFADPRVMKMMGKKQPFDMKQLVYGGFATLVDA